MATTLGTIVSEARKILVEPVEIAGGFWTDAELLAHAIRGAQDLWKKVIDVFQDHFLVINPTSVSFPANATTLSGVPSDCFRVSFMEPRSLTTYVNLFFRPKKYNSPEFRLARSLSAQDPTGNVFVYDIIGEGTPLAAPTIYVSPPVNAEIPLTLGYIRSVPNTLTSASNNPIPGETDQALIAWTVAQARAKEREDRSPDPEWLAVYATEAKNLMTVVTPRQEDEPEVVEGFLEGDWG